MTTSVTAQLPLQQVLTQREETESLPYGVFCRFKLDNAEGIRENANKLTDKLWPVYVLSVETAEKVFGIELSKDHQNIRIQIHGSQDSDAGRIDAIRFLDVVEGNKEQIKEILQLTNTSYEVNKIWSNDEAAFYNYFIEKSYFLTARSVEMTKDSTYLELKSKADAGAKRTWDADRKCREAASVHKFWPCHFFICMQNPYQGDYYGLK